MVKSSSLWFLKSSGGEEICLISNYNYKEFLAIECIVIIIEGDFWLPALSVSVF